MPVAVERIILNPQYASNCYLIRAGARTPPRQSSSIPAATRRRSSGARAPRRHPAGDPRHPHRRRPHRRRRRARARAGAEVWAPAGRARGAPRAARRAAATRSLPTSPSTRSPSGDTGGGRRPHLRGRRRARATRPTMSRSPSTAALFSGDLLFAGSVGRTDLAGGDWQTPARLGRDALLERFGPDAVVYPGHGEPTTLGRELETQPVPRRAARSVARVSAKFQAPRGTHDVLPAEQPLWFDTVVRTMEEVTALYGYGGIQTPGVRGHRRSSSERRAPARTSSRRRCTRSPIAATAR